MEEIQHSIVFFLLCISFLTADSDPKYRKFVLGGLFPVHEKGNKSHPCGTIMKEKGIQRMEAMFYAIKTINDNSTFWNFTLGANMLDTCSSDSHALDESLKFLRIECSTNTSQRVTGVIGAANSPVSESVATIFRLFQIPQISYASTSTELDDIHKYPYFFRVVPSDIFQVKAMVELLSRLNWTFLSTVASEGEYGENAVQELEIYARSHEVCFGARVKIGRNPEEKDYSAAIEKLLSVERARAIVVFLNEDKLRKLLAAAKKMGVKGRRLLWLGSDSWGKKNQVVKGVEDVVEGAITVLPTQVPVLAEFDEYFKALHPDTHYRNLWFREFWESQFQCSLGEPKSDHSFRGAYCSGKDDLSKNYKQEGLVPMVIDAVYVMAQALKDMCTAEPQVCLDENEPPSGKKLKNYIQKVSIASSRGHGMRINFDSNKSVPVNYTIYQFQKNSLGLHEYISIGSWSKDGLILKTNWTGTASSVCSLPCKPGWERIQQDRNNKCCWKCRKCQENHYVPSPTNSCTPCGDGYIVDDDASSCIWIEPEYFGKDMSSPWTTIPLVFAILGIICCIVMYMAFLIYHNTPIIMASGRELCHLIFLGVFLCYCFTFTIVAHPEPFICGMVRVGLGLGLALCYSAIFTKTNRISRIFNRKLRSAKRPRYVTPKSQLVICMSLVLIELTLSAIWLLLQPPQVIYKPQMDKTRPLVKMCDMDDASVCLGLVFNGLLIIMCTVYAYKTRKIPENFNEAKYISFVMYSTCIIWMAFVPTYFSVSSDYKAKCTLLCMSVSMSGTVALICIFSPKLYIAVFQPQKNVRFPTTTNSATGAYTGPIRFIKNIQTKLSPETKLCGTDKKSATKSSPEEPRTENHYDNNSELEKAWKKRKISQP